MKYRRKIGSLLSGALTCAFALMSNGVAVAQTPGTPMERESGWLTWVIAGGLIIVVCLTGFLNAKRSHLN